MDSGNGTGKSRRRGRGKSTRTVFQIDLPLATRSRRISTGFRLAKLEVGLDEHLGTFL